MSERTRLSLADAENIARAFHEAYERLAPSFGYETRKESAVRWEDVPEPNRSLMIAVAAEVRALPFDTSPAPLNHETVTHWLGEAFIALDTLHSAVRTIEREAWPAITWDGDPDQVAALDRAMDLAGRVLEMIEGPAT